MSEILSIEQLREMATPVIEIPGFEGTGTINVRVRRPRLMALASQGRIPNHLLGIANDLLFKKKESNKQPDINIKDMAGMMELFCKACLVEPTYEEFKDIMTDDQQMEIFHWAMGGTGKLDSFREDKKVRTNDNPSEQVPQKTE